RTARLWMLAEDHLFEQGEGIRAPGVLAQDLFDQLERSRLVMTPMKKEPGDAQAHALGFLSSERPEGLGQQIDEGLDAPLPFVKPLEQRSNAGVVRTKREKPLEVTDGTIGIGREI